MIALERVKIIIALSLKSCTFYAWVLSRVVSVLWSLTATLDLWLFGGFFDDWL